ncbi:MAG TPA: phosphoribosylamine--glycine ligase [Myxococcota bacterium]|nr:phosphoribosylamine--glycine ligase [Myxococcota bacterium]
MHILLVGSGGREHALAWKIARSPLVSDLLAAPGSDAIAAQARCFPDVAAADVPALVALAREQRVDLVVVGPEDPLVAGLADRLREAGIAVFGPSAAAARLEGSKSFAKAFMQRHRIPTAAFAAFDDLDAARAHVHAQSSGCVVKADGLAAGKGVAVCETPAQAIAALDEAMGQRRFGTAGDRVVIEERLVGEEASYYAITDGDHVVALAAAQDHKRIGDGDRGENTGGMGAYAPALVVDAAVEKKVLERIVYPAVRGLAAEGMPYCGVLFVGLMIDAAGDPRVIEFNVRFGDPETQPLVMQMESDLVPLLDGAARGALGRAAPPENRGSAVCVVLASEGYPRAVVNGRRIEGLDAVRDPDVVVFHAGTRRQPDGGFVTAGGRVLGVTARGDSAAIARERAYRAAERITFEGRQYRSDIAARAHVSRSGPKASEVHEVGS